MKSFSNFCRCFPQPWEPCNCISIARLGVSLWQSVVGNGSAAHSDPCLDTKHGGVVSWRFTPWASGVAFSCWADGVRHLGNTIPWVGVHRLSPKTIKVSHPSSKPTSLSSQIRGMRKTGPQPHRRHGPFRGTGTSSSAVHSVYTSNCMGRRKKLEK